MATNLNRGNGDAYYDLGKALFMSGETGSAIEALRTATQLNASDPSPHYLLARALEKSGNQAEADAEWARFNELKKARPATGGMATGRNQ